MANILHMLSGGLDSVCALYTLLKDTNHSIWAHHILLDHEPNRCSEEKIATSEITRWLTENVRRFTFTQNTFTYPTEFRVYPSDMAVVGFVAGGIATSFTLKYGIAFNFITTGLTASDFSKEGPTVRTAIRNELMQKMFEYQKMNLATVTLPPEYNKNLKLLDIVPEVDWYPISDLSKREVIDRLPAELVGLCWSCLKPASFLTPCGKCNTCKELKTLRVDNHVGKTLIENKTSYSEE